MDLLFLVVIHSQIDVNDRMKLALDLILHNYNRKKDEIITLAMTNMQKLEDKNRGTVLTTSSKIISSELAKYIFLFSIRSLHINKKPKLGRCIMALLFTELLNM